MKQICPNKASNARFISIVDDDASVRISTRRLLKSSGFEAVAFESAETFLQSDYLETTACLLLDVCMPGIGGLGLQSRLAELGLSIPIVFLSARATEEEERRAMRNGAAAFLHKPARQEELLLAIRAAMVGR